MATVNLGSIKFNWQGAYNGATAYAVDDVVSYNGSSYICKLASTGNLPTNTTYFDQMSSAGTNGTDLTSTLTTQGDLVYRDGSGLQRLGAGTAGQVLQTGGAGANPSWGTLSSDWVLLGSVSASSSSSISLDGFYTSDYDIYEIYGSNLVPNTNSASLRWRVRSGNADITTNSYIGGYQPNIALYFDGSGYYNAPTNDPWDNPSFLEYSGMNYRDAISLSGTHSNGSGGYDSNARARYNTSESGHNINWKITAYNPLSTRQWKMYKMECIWNTQNTNSIGKTMGMNGFFTESSSTTAHSGISFFPNTGTLTSGKMYVYGLKNN